LKLKKNKKLCQKILKQLIVVLDKEKNKELNNKIDMSEKKWTKS